MATDDRLSWIDKRMNSSLECKSSLSSVDAQILRDVYTFFERIDLRTLFVSTKPETYEPYISLVPLRVPPGQKVLVFRKCYGVSVIAESEIDDQLVVTELVATPWYQLWLMSRDVYLPILATCVEQPSTHVFAQADSKRVHDAHLKLLSTMQMTEGYMNGRVMLPLPMISGNVSSGSESPNHGIGIGRASQQSTMAKFVNINNTTNSVNGNKEYIHQLESALVSWSKIIKGLLKVNVGDIVRQVRFAGPHVELQAFQQHTRHLISVEEQLQSIEVQAIIEELEVASSSYVHSFNSLKEEVAAARAEVQNILTTISACKPYFDVLTDPSVPIYEAISNIPPLLHSLFLVWRHCEWYRKAKRFQRLLRLVCNQIVTRSKLVITTSPTNNFPDGLEDELRLVLRLCASFRGTYLDVRDKAQTVAMNLVQQQFVDDRHVSVVMSSKQEAAMEQTFKAALAAWPERSDGPFRRFNNFIDRCNDILDLAESVHHFKQLQFLVLGGPHGSRLSTGISQISSEFLPALRDFEAQRLNLVDIDEGLFCWL